MPNVPDNANYRLPWYLLTCRDDRADPLADRILTTEETLCHCLVDYDCPSVVRYVLFGHNSAGKKRDAHCLKVIGAGASKIDLRSITGRNFATLDREKGSDVVQRAHQRQSRDESH